MFAGREKSRKKEKKNHDLIFVVQEVDEEKDIIDEI